MRILDIIEYEAKYKKNIILNSIQWKTTLQREYAMNEYYRLDAIENYAKIAKTFKNDETKKYQFLLEEFSQRILLESYLLEIRNKCTDIA